MNHQISKLETLPAELIVQILSNLDYLDVLSATFTCKTIRNAGLGLLTPWFNLIFDTPWGSEEICPTFDFLPDRFGEPEARMRVKVVRDDGGYFVRPEANSKFQRRFFSLSDEETDNIDFSQCMQNFLEQASIMNLEIKGQLPDTFCHLLATTLASKPAERLLVSHCYLLSPDFLNAARNIQDICRIDISQQFFEALIFSKKLIRHLFDQFEPWLDDDLFCSIPNVQEWIIRGDHSITCKGIVRFIKTFLLNPPNLPRIELDSGDRRSEAGLLRKGYYVGHRTVPASKEMLDSVFSYLCNLDSNNLTVREDEQPQLDFYFGQMHIVVESRTAFVRLYRRGMEVKIVQFVKLTVVQ